MCPLTIDPTFLPRACLISPLPDFPSPLPASCRFIPISSTHMWMHTHTQTHSSVCGGVNSESRRHPLIRSAAPPLSGGCLCGSLPYCQPRSPVAERLHKLPASYVSGQWSAGVSQRTIPLLKIQQLLSSSMRSWLYQFLVQTVAPRGSEVWIGKAAVGTVTQRPLKIWEELVSVWDRVSGTEWGCKTIYGSLWLLCKHGRDERKENRGGQRSHDSETGGGVRIRKAVMITDQSQPPEAGARQVVYTHTRTRMCARTYVQTQLI